MTRVNRSLVVVDDSLDDAFQIDYQLNNVHGFAHRFQHYVTTAETRADILSRDVDVAMIAVGKDGVGQGLLVDLRQAGFVAPLIMLCDDTQIELIPELMRCGADDCLVKSSLAGARLVESIETAERQAEARDTDIEQRNLLTKTLTASVMILVDMLASLKPKAFGRARRCREYMRLMSYEFEESRRWELEVAALLSPLGCIQLSEALLDHVEWNRPLTASETEQFYQHPARGAAIIRAIPRLESVAEMVLYQEKRFDGEGPPDEDIAGEDIPLGARMLKIALDLQALRHAGHSVEAALTQMTAVFGAYDFRLLEVLRAQIGQAADFSSCLVSLNELGPAMVLEEHITTTFGAVIVPAGSTVSDAQLLHLMKLAADDQLRQPFRVRIAKPHSGALPMTPEKQLTEYLLRTEG